MPDKDDPVLAEKLNNIIYEGNLAIEEYGDELNLNDSEYLVFYLYRVAEKTYMQEDKDGYRKNIINWMMTSQGLTMKLYTNEMNEEYRDKFIQEVNESARAQVEKFREGLK